ncbi:hypothetical protein A3J15_01060 [Candidatus Roizmanbacteria bacterium RIFCSPLOWO2_02_FULL_38_10]|uniref:Uncharacterized protein n=1 Tax=Candidatus Roizmanbacteria bacterium RIFCSPLOWO2_02_FULL_38_10 TaxID=1802074 RepID=A0A1F7JPB4_9BACT|nr:MAG: hypothetical protein A3J15_01060 [Candidatus Roizmanbacteria bacterium RIFCSPLOWO2_02_FULL_38_10]
MKTKKPTSPMKASTQVFIELETVKDDVLMLQDKSCSIIIKCGATNFGLLSEEEQRSMIYSYAGLLNSLSFPVQILILSKRMDISSYLDYIDIKIASQLDEGIKQQLISYKEFIKNIVKKNTILEKNFYFVIPFSPLEMGLKSTQTGHLNREYVLTRAKTALYPKKDHLLRLLKKIGLSAIVLQEQEIIELFYNLYNPSPSGTKLAPINSYTTVISTS